MAERLGPFDLGRVHRADALLALRELPKNSIAAVVTDPPYSSGGMFRGDRTRSTREKYVTSGQSTVSEDFAGDSRDQRAWASWCAEWLCYCHHATVPGGLAICFCDWRQLPSLTDAMQMAGWVWRGIAVWDKTEGVRPMLGRFRAQAEFLVWGTKGPHTGTGGTYPGVFRCPPSSTGSDHQTAKPEAVMEWLLGPVQQGVVVDPFAGGGATAVACQRRGLRFLGFEITTHWADYANRRLGVLPSEGGTPLFTGDAA